MQKRNIVVILCDQIRKDFLHPYGCSAIPTPNIDQLARMGVVFDNAITQSPVCAPARASMMTGRFVSDHKVWTNDVPFREGLDYLPERMNALGYMTGAFGKLHHFPATDGKGFQHMSLMEEGRLKHNEGYLKFLNETYPQTDTLWNYDPMKLEFKYHIQDYYEHWIASEAIDFMQQHKDTPFFAWVSFQGPHTPIDPPLEVRGSVNNEKIPKPFKRKSDHISSVVRYRKAFTQPNFLGKQHYTNEEIQEIRTKYAEEIVAIDMQIGRMLKSLEKNGILDNTTIIFSADHGDLMGDFDLFHKGPFIYKGQLEIPLIISNHPCLKNATRSDCLAGNIDIPSTVLDVAGDEKGLGISTSLLSLCTNKVKEKKWNYSEFCDSVRIVENKRFRYCYYSFTGESELFDKINDPEETVNLAGQAQYGATESECLKGIVDFMIISKGICIEAHDLVPEVQEGLSEKNANWQDDFVVAMPISSLQEINFLRDEGLSTTYNEFCINKKIIASYGAYWNKKD